MDLLLSIVMYVVLGLLGLTVLLVIVTLVFGKRVTKKWEYEAHFRDTRGRKIGKFEIKLSMVEKEESDFSLKVKFYLRHDSLAPHDTVRVFLNDLLVLEGMVSDGGRIRLDDTNVRNKVARPDAGHICRVECGGAQLAAEPVHAD